MGKEGKTAFVEHRLIFLFLYGKMIFEKIINGFTLIRGSKSLEDSLIWHLRHRYLYRSGAASMLSIYSRLICISPLIIMIWFYKKFPHKNKKQNWKYWKCPGSSENKKEKKKTHYWEQGNLHRFSWIRIESSCVP